MAYLKVLAVLTSVLVAVNADCYLHNPRGSNNRLNENTATRQNGNRLFDSQNNNRGGYNVGVATTQKHTRHHEQFDLVYFQSTGVGGKSELEVEWTNQHGCGGSEGKDPHKLNCNLVVQFMCQPEYQFARGQPQYDKLRNGENTNTQPYQRGHFRNREQRKRNSARMDRGIHESFDNYDRCHLRDRNQGLFTADQKLKGHSAIYTRQNPNGQRRGFECPEERDYYPYWHPTPWIDIAVLTDDVSKCPFYEKETNNAKPRGECLKEGSSERLKYNNIDDCEDHDGEWFEFHQYLEKSRKYGTQKACESASTRHAKYVWGVPWDATDPTRSECLVLPPPVKCQSAEWTRSNHLGDARGMGNPQRFTWEIPHFPSRQNHRCVLRVRYNTSTDDYNPWKTNHRSNGKHSSPIQNDPTVPTGLGHSPLQLAINTAQTGRIFQDRSHVFTLAPRPQSISPVGRLINLNVRGKRCNIVQCYPAVEYDFVPNRMKISPKDYVHIQWTGSNTHNNGGNGGDGQAGDDGQGTGGTDRNNFVEIPSPGVNFPTPFEHSKLWRQDTMKVVWSGLGDATIFGLQDIAAQAASSGYYHAMTNYNGGKNSVEAKAPMNPLLNNATPSFRGFVFQIAKKGKYHYMSSRNNNFSNRSQKGHIIVQ